MKVLRFKCGMPEWSVPLDELSADMKRMLQMQWREFINELGDVDESNIVGKVDPAVIAILERLFASGDSTVKT
jgi:hypothetical protein